MPPDKPDGIFLAGIFQKIARLGVNHPVFHPATKGLAREVSSKV
jgi:hypothetical protein